MGTMSEVGVHVACKPHRCSWCSEAITPGEVYTRWRWYGDDGASTVKMHHECLEAQQDSTEDEWHEGENPRGCYCGFTAGCETCAARKGQKTEAQP